MSEKRTCCAVGEIVSQTRSASLSPVKREKIADTAPRNEQHQCGSAQSIAQPLDARASIAEQRHNNVAGDISEHSNSQKRNREVVDNWMQMVSGD
ncbi:MAG: hypothetical protein ACXU9H_03985 [Candidatus Binataceae bacterium]